VTGAASATRRGYAWRQRSASLPSRGDEQVHRDPINLLPAAARAHNSRGSHPQEPPPRLRYAQNAAGPVDFGAQSDLRRA
jgi:hypothetical protein